MSIAWENYDLPSFQLGSTRSQPSPYIVSTPYAGRPFIRTVTKELGELPVTWDVSLVLSDDQAQEFNVFLDDLYTGDGFFTKFMETEAGSNNHTLTILGERPQGTRTANNVWSYSFTLYSGALDLTVTPVPPPAEVPPYPAPGIDPTISGFLYMPPDMLNTGGAAGVDQLRFIESARDVGKAIVLTLEGRAAITSDKGQTWTQLTQFLNSGAPDPSQGQDLAISADGQVIYASFFGGYVSKSSDGGTTFSPLTRGLSNPGGNFFACKTLATNDTGTLLVAVFEDGQVMRSTNGGQTFSPVYKIGTQIGKFPKIVASKDGETMVIGIENDAIENLTGAFYISTDGGQNWTEELNQFGIGSAGRPVSAMAISLDGNTFIFSSAPEVEPGNGVAGITTDGFATFSEITSTNSITGGNNRFTGLATNSRGSNIVALTETEIIVSTDRAETWEIASGDYLGTYGFAQGATGNLQFFMVIDAVKGYIASPDFVQIPVIPVGRAPDTWQNYTPRYLNTGSTSTSLAHGTMTKDAQKIMYVASGGFGSRSLDNATSFTAMAQGFGISQVVVSATDVETSYQGEHTYIVCNDGYASKTEDFGDTFTELPRGLTMTSTVDIRTVSTSEDGQTVFVGNEAGQAAISYNAGATFNRLSDTLGGSGQVLQTSCMSADGQIIFIGRRLGDAAISTDGGATFTGYPRGIAGAEQNIESCCMSVDGQVIFAGKANGDAVVSADGGQTWAIKTALDLNTGTSAAITASAMSQDGSVIVLAMTGAYVSYSDDFGATWNQLPRNLNMGSNVDILDFATNGDLWMAFQFAGRAAISRGA